MPNGTGRFHFYSDTSKFATRSVLYQIQNGKPKLITYAGKRLPDAAKNYSITELELCELAINIASFSHLLKRVDFDAVVDHLTLTHIIKSNSEPATPRIKRLLELISSYSFNLYYMKGKDMVLSDFLSRQTNDDSNTHEIIPISFNMHQVLQENYYNLKMYLLQTRSQVRSSSIKLPEVHGIGKSLDPNIKPEKQQTNSLKDSINQDRAGSKRRERPDPINRVINLQTKLSKKISEKRIITGGTEAHTRDLICAINNANEGMAHKRPMISDVPIHPGPILRPPPKSIRSNIPTNQQS